MFMTSLKFILLTEYLLPRFIHGVACCCNVFLFTVSLFLLHHNLLVHVPIDEYVKCSQVSAPESRHSIPVYICWWCTFAVLHLLVVYLGSFSLLC